MTDYKLVNTSLSKIIKKALKFANSIISVFKEPIVRFLEIYSSRILIFDKIANSQFLS